MEIEYVNWGVGNVIDGKIYINKALRKFPDLEKKVINHELRHIRGEKWVDWNEPFSWKMLWFCVAHPTTWRQWLPVWIDVRITVSVNMLLWWTFVALWVVLVVLVNLWILK